MGFKPQTSVLPSRGRAWCSYNSAKTETVTRSRNGLRGDQTDNLLEVNGIATQASAGGRAECTIRGTPLPVTYLDFHAQFPAVSKLLDCREILCAETLEFPDFTVKARELVERAGLSEFTCAVISSLVTGGSHLLCAMLERTVRDMGGQIAAMDKDSAMIVSTKDGGLVPCAGGPHRVANYQEGSAAIRALSFC